MRAALMRQSGYERHPAVPDKWEVSDIRLPFKSLEELSNFRLPPGTHRRSGDLGRCLVFAQVGAARTQVVVLTMAEFRLRLGVRGGRTAYRPSGEPRKVGLLPAALLAMHRVEATARPGLAFRSATPRDREVMTGGTGAFLSPPCARGGSGDKIPPVSVTFSQ